MAKRNPNLLIQDMLRAGSKIQRYIHDLSESGFRNDEKTVDAVVRNLEIIGEASSQMPPKFTSGNPEIPWAQLRGLRNRIVHAYFGVDEAIIWKIVSSDLPTLMTELKNLHYS